MPSLSMLLLLGHFLLQQSAAQLEPHRTYLIAVTDPHGFFSGHQHGEKYDADYPALSSFADTLREQAKRLDGCEVFLFENGDLVDGAGLTSEDLGKRMTFPILDEVGFDARNLGNHELYNGDTLRALKFPGAFVSSNVLDKSTHLPFAHRYRVLPGRAGNVLVLGFLYNLKNYDSKVAYVETVESSLAGDWFGEAMSEPNVRFVVVLAHMDYKDALVRVILNAIREKTRKDLPVIFVTGHTHLRRSATLDDFAFSLETGRYMDTIGVLSFPNDPSPGQPLQFRREYVDASKAALEHWTKSNMETNKAIQLRGRLREVRKALKLDQVVGYSPFTYYTNLPFDAPFSLVRYWVNRVVPAALLDSGVSCPGFFIGGAGAVRYHLFKGFITQDAIWAIGPFQDGFRVVRCLPAELLLQLLAKLPTKIDDAVLLEAQGLHVRKPLNNALPVFVHSSTKSLDPSKMYDVVFGMYEMPAVMHYLNALTKSYKDEPFREGQVNGHTIWKDYLTNRFFKDATMIAKTIRQDDFQIASIATRV